MVSAVSSVSLQVGRGLVLAIGAVILTWIFFAPVVFGHHIVACGVLAPIVLNGETPKGGQLLWGEYEVRFFPGRFAVSIALWGCTVFLLFWFLRRRQNGR
jgi:hypothetical protein